MPADVEERTQSIVRPAHDDQRFPRDRAQHVVAAPRDPARAPHAAPLPREDPLPFLGENLRRGVVLARHRVGALLIGRHRALKGRHLRPPAGERLASASARRAASQPAPPRTPGPGWAPDPPRYKPSIGMAYRPQPATGRMNRIWSSSSSPWVMPPCVSAYRSSRSFGDSTDREV